MADNLPSLSELTSLRDVCIAFLVVSWITVGVRMYVRAFMANGLKLDDLLLVLAQLCFTIFCAVGIVIVFAQESLATAPTLDKINQLRMLITVSTCTFYPIMVLVKSSIGVTFAKLFWHEESRLKLRLIIGATAILAVSGVTCVILGALFLDTFNPTGLMPTKNIKFDVLNIVFASINAVVDVLVCSFAIIAIMRTQLPRADRIAASLLFALGSSGAWLAIYRLSIIARYSASESPKAGIRTETYSVIEAGVTIVAFSIMATRPLMTAARRRLGSMTDSMTAGTAPTYDTEDKMTGRSNSGGFRVDSTFIVHERGTKDGASTITAQMQV